LVSISGEKENVAMNVKAKTVAPGIVLVGMLSLGAGTAAAGGHTWDVNELFSNADGTIQFIELREGNGTPNEVNTQGKVMSSDAKNFTITVGPLEAPTSNKHFLIATASFAALDGAPTPDMIIPAGVLPMFFDTGGDSVDYSTWDTLTFGAGVLPTDGINSLNADLTTGMNSPTNYADESGSVDASPAAACPNTCGDVNGGGGPVDLNDFATFATCFGIDPSTSTACACSDLNEDGTINLNDFATFAGLFGESSTTSIPNCSD